ncbi:MAG TPA: LysR family transcriptional regulator [Acetobacteraceae bacterium]|nr:LysR family transcriptional regulator [Acetobacteraceae bacterium]
MDRLDELAIFVAIIEAGSLAAAARRLRRSPPAVTRALAALEQRLGTRLVERTTRRLAPTETGRRLAEQSRRLLTDFSDAVRLGSDEASSLRGFLRITAPLVFGRLHVMPLLSGFLDQQEALQAELVLSDRYLDMVEDGLDVAVRIGRLADSGLVARRVGQVRRVLVASPEYLSARGSPACPGDLRSHAIIFTSGRPVQMEWRFEANGRRVVVRVSPRLIVNQVDAALLAAREGRGIASALSYQVADDVTAGRLVRLLRPWEGAPLPVQLVVPGSRYMAARVRAFLDYAADGLATLDVLRTE